MSEADSRSSTVRRIFLVRHGVTAWNKELRFQGHTDIPLDEEGRAQAYRVALRLKKWPVAAVFSSDLVRARETAEIVAAEHSLTVRTHAELRETGLGKWEGMTRDEIVAQGEGELLALYLIDSEAHPAPGAEPLVEVFERLSGIFERLLSENRGVDIVIVGHGGSLRATLCSLLGAPMGSMRRFWLDNASVTTVEERIRPAGTFRRILAVNDTCHLNV